MKRAVALARAIPIRSAADTGPRRVARRADEKHAAIDTTIMSRPIATTVSGSAGEQGVWCHDGLDFHQRAPAELLGLRGQTDALIVREPHLAGSELLAQHAVLLLQISDRIARGIVLTQDP